jgi:anti-anti-sigma factor
MRADESGYSVRVVTTPPGITIELSADSDGVTLDVEGELDLATAPTLLRIATESISADVDRVMTIVLKGVGFCDSAGISALVSIRKLCDQHGWRLRVSQPTVTVRRVLELTGLVQYLNVE